MIVYRPRKNGSVALYWVPCAKATALGYPTKTANITADPDAAVRLQTEMEEWLAARTYDGTFRALITRYLTIDESPYFQSCRSSTRENYYPVAQRIIREIGTQRVKHCTGQDVVKWFGHWSHGGTKLAAGHKVLAVLKSAVSFGVACRLDDCQAFKQCIENVSFEHPKARELAPDTDDVRKLIEAAIANRAPERALCYALQFETALRQTDVLSLTWGDIDKASMIMTKRPSKTERTSGVNLDFDLTLCPMTMKLLADDWSAKLPPETPLLRHAATGEPLIWYRLNQGWHADMATAGLRGVWNRDLRAAAITIAGIHGAALSDRAKAAGHTSTKMTMKYDRSTIDAHRRVRRAVLSGNG